MKQEINNRIRLGAVLYASNTPARNALADFASGLQNRGWLVSGFIQHVKRDQTGQKIGLDAINIKTGEHLPLARPTTEDLKAGSCGFDVGLLAETSHILRDALQEPTDLLVIEKFGEREQEGRGLSEEIITAALSGIPTLVAVPIDALEKWNKFAGNLSVLLPHNSRALWDWWPKKNLYKDLILPLTNDPIKRIVIGENSLLVEGPHGCGVTQNPLKKRIKPPEITGLSLKGLALQSQEDDTPLSLALSTAAILAHYNRYDLQGPSHSGLDHFKETNNSVLVLGNFPPNIAYSNNARNMPSEQGLEHLNDYGYDGLILASHTFREGSLARFLEVAPHSETVLVGPETPMSPRLFDYAIDVLCGRIIENPEKAAEIVTAGGSPKDLKQVSRYITFEKINS